MVLNAITMGILGSSSTNPSVNYYGDPYWVNDVLLVHGSSFTDTSPSSSTLSSNGASINTSIMKYGTGSMYFNGAGTVTSTVDANFGSSNFTIEAWIYPTAFTNTNAMIAGQHYYGVSSRWILMTNTAGKLYYWCGLTSDNHVSTATISLNTWTHVAVTRVGTTHSFYINGVFDSSFTSSDTYTAYAYPITIGSDYTRYSTTFFNGYINDVRVTKGISRYNANFTVPNRLLPDPYAVLQPQYDPYFNQVTGLYTGNAATDSSNVSATITNNGVQFLSSKAAYGSTSMYCNGSSYATIPDSDYYDLGAVDFTIEAWLNMPTLPNSFYGIVTKQRQAASYGEWVFTILSGGYLNFSATTGGEQASWNLIGLSSSSAITANTWNHVAVTRYGNIFTLWLNGINVGTSTVSGTITNGTSALAIGAQKDGGYQTITGYIDDLRITKGVARYTASFNPPVSQYYDPSYGDPYWDYTTLLLTGETLTDSSQTARSLTNLGGASLSNITYKYGTSSLNLTSSALYTPSSISLSSSINFTYEGWFYNSSYTGTRTLMQLYNSFGTYYMINTVSGAIALFANGTGSIATTGSVSVNTWNHVAWVNTNGITTIYLNGNQIYSGSLSYAATTYQFFIGVANYTDGGYFSGYADDVRFTNGIARYISNFTPPQAALPVLPGKDPYRANVVALLSGDALVDSSPTPLTITNSGVTINSSTYKYGTGSMYFNGSSYCSIAATSSFDMFSGDCTIEFWFNPTSTSSANYIMEFDSSSANNRLSIGLANNLFTVYYQTGAASYATFISYSYTTAASFTHCTISKKGSTWYTFFNGVLQGTVTNSTVPTGNLRLIMGSFAPVDSTYYLTGYIDDLRITKGVARYTSSFTPPTHASIAM